MPPLAPQPVSSQRVEALEVSPGTILLDRTEIHDRPKRDRHRAHWPVRQPSPAPLQKVHPRPQPCYTVSLEEHPPGSAACPATSRAVPWAPLPPAQPISAQPASSRSASRTVRPAELCSVARAASAQPRQPVHARGESLPPPARVCSHMTLRLRRATRPVWRAAAPTIPTTVAGSQSEWLPTRAPC